MNSGVHTIVVRSRWYAGWCVRGPQTRRRARGQVAWPTCCAAPSPTTFPGSVASVISVHENRLSDPFRVTDADMRRKQTRAKPLFHVTGDRDRCPGRFTRRGSGSMWDELGPLRRADCGRVRELGQARACGVAVADLVCRRDIPTVSLSTDQGTPAEMFYCRIADWTSTGADRQRRNRRHERDRRMTCDVTVHPMRLLCERTRPRRRGSRRPICQIRQTHRRHERRRDISSSCAVIACRAPARGHEKSVIQQRIGGAHQKDCRWQPPQDPPSAARHRSSR